MKILRIIAALAVTFAAAHQAHAVPVEYSFQGSFGWDGLSTADPVSADVEFSGTVLLENGMNGVAGSFDDFDGLTINGTVFDDSNVGIHIVIGVGEMRLTIGGGVPNSINPNTNDFSFEFFTSSVPDFTNAPPDSFELFRRTVLITNEGISTRQQPDAPSGSIEFTRVLDPIDDPPTNGVSAPAAAPLVLVGLAALGFVNRRRKADGV